MKISIIIPVKPGGAVTALEPIHLLDALPDDYEVIVAEGKKPSRQRNVAAEVAGGDILYFLDDDSAVAPDALKRLERHFADEHVAAVGGPSLTHPNNSPFQRAIAYALASLFGGGGIRNRYRQHGMLRETDDSELILCNLAFRKEVYLAVGGLDERLYPNEENKLIDRLIAEGRKLLHDPQLVVMRSQRPTLKAFVRQMLNYGRGRAEQSLLSGSISLKPMIPALFFCYIVTLPFFWSSWLLVPLYLNVAGMFLNMISACRAESFALVCRLPMVYSLLHFCYGAGFIAGLISPRFRRCETGRHEPQLRRIKEFGSCW
jgi:cellulose synthase/poly-beta-1,6-N-acetylglucosamine synthase-like glycosyltransferase